jgi:hypothetical protein
MPLSTAWQSPRGATAEIEAAQNDAGRECLQRRSRISKAISFDGITRDLSGVSTRRNVLRLFGGAAAAGVVAATGFGETEAKRKKGKKKQKRGKKGQQVCTPLGSVTVPAMGAAVTTPVLKQGQAYVLRATGYCITNATYGNDAFAAFPFANPNVPETTYQNVRLRLSVDGGSPDQWGRYTTSHIYERQIMGQGAALSLRFTDPVPADNSGSLLVEIFRA